MTLSHLKQDKLRSAEHGVCPILLTRPDCDSPTRPHVSFVVHTRRGPPANIHSGVLDRCSKRSDSEILYIVQNTKEKMSLFIPEVDRRACALIKSVLAINGIVGAPFIWEPKFQIWWRSVKNWECYRLSNALTSMRSSACTHIHTHARTYVRMDINWKLSFSNSMSPCTICTWVGQTTTHCR